MSGRCRELYTRAEDEGMENKKFWEELTANYPSPPHPPQTKRKNQGGGHTDNVKFEMGSGAMIYIPTFIKIGSGIQI
jgi:hypothetical protein